MEPTDERININVRTQDGAIRVFTISKDTPIVRLLKRHCERVDIDYRAVEFLIKGQRFDHRKTPAQLKLKDECLIEAFVRADGGGPKRV